METDFDNEVATCRLDGCDLPGTLRGDFCTERHREEHRKARWRLRKQRQRERESSEVVEGASDGRSIPNGPDVRTPPTEHHASRKFARRNEPDLIDYVSGTADRKSFHGNQRVLPQQQLQRFRPPAREDDTWQPADTDYYEGVHFGPRSDMTDGPYGGYNSCGNPVAFQVVRKRS